MRNFDPDKHAKQVQDGVTGLEDSIKKNSEKVAKAKETAAAKAKAKADADKKVEDLEADGRVLAGRLAQAKSVLATLQNNGERPAVADEVDENQETLPVA